MWRVGTYTNCTQDILQKISSGRFRSSTLYCLTLIYIALIQRPNLKNEAEWLACFEQVSCTCLAYRWIINRRFVWPFLEECLMQQQTNSSWIYVAGAMASAVQNLYNQNTSSDKNFLKFFQATLYSNWDFYVLNRDGDRIQTSDTLNRVKLINNYICHLFWTITNSAFYTHRAFISVE